jgi:hypothetical protein
MVSMCTDTVQIAPKARKMLAIRVDAVHSRRVTNLWGMASRGHTTNYLTIVCPCLSTAYYLLGREHISSLVRRMILAPDRS